MGVFRFCVIFVLTCECLLASRQPFLQLQRGKRGDGDWGEDDTEVKLCTIAATTGFSNRIKVFADEQDNTRYVSFSREGYATDDGFVESMLKCKGVLSDICKHPQVGNLGCAECPCELDTTHDPYGNYQRRMLDYLTPSCQGSRSYRVLLVGLGGGSLAQHIFARCSRGTEVEAVEYDPRMIEVANRFFGLAAGHKNFKTEQGDGGVVVGRRAAEGQIFDIVIVDVFAGGSNVPESCRSIAFVGNLRRIVKNGGIVLHNMGGFSPASTLAFYVKSFGRNATTLETLRGNNELPSSLIVARVA